MLREHLRRDKGRRSIKLEDRPRNTPETTVQLLVRAAKAGQHIGAVCERIHGSEGENGVRRVLGVLSLAKKHGGPPVNEAVPSPSRPARRPTDS